ncbi:histidine kinase [Paenibacillus yonginensis]|uniref:histidine kinase n=1 Tax=Paenibacillus yonginensis TaxID=1462996 RepID=A0A1B1MW63_9BACL|nr:sensor histidine kinase [Paenibacillus yonginensis]ANS73395.1 histidine kinase [Paenibacillus yonginensis]
MRKGIHSIHHRLFLLFLFCMSGILLIVSLLYYNRTTSEFHQKISDLSTKNVSQTVALFDLLYKGYDSLSKTLSNNFDMVRVLSETTDEPALQYINEQSITNMIGAVFYSREDLIGIHVITNKGKIYNYGNYFNIVDPNYRFEDWYKELTESSGRLVLLGVFPHSLIDQNESRPVFAFGRQIYNLDEHKPIGIVLYETDSKPILSALDNLKLSAHSQVYLMSKDDRVIFSTDTSGEDAPKLPAMTDSQDVVVQQDKQKLTVASSLPFSDWAVASVTPNQDLNVEMVQMQRYLLIVITILIIVSALIASMVSRTISQPLIRLIREMKQVEIGNFRGEVNVTSYMEINSLVASFNRMVHRIEELIERVKISSVSEKNAELHALQSQVNPHFLYNTLDMIYWMLDEKGQDNLGEVVLSLSHMFRYSSQWQAGAKVTLREELEQIQHYLTIIKMRLEGRLQVEVQIEDNLMDIRLPKMTLQPVIENAVKHGLEALDRPGRLLVHSREQGDTLEIIIQDNGNGMEQPVLGRLKQSLNGGQELETGAKSGGIGLINLHRRLQYMYGPEAGLEIESSPGQGTTVIIKLPQLEEGGTGL